MPTALDVVTEALVIIGELEAGETVPAVDAQTGTTKLNDMLHGWKLQGIDFKHITAAQADTLRIPDEFIMGIKYNLAAYLAPEYGATMAPGAIAIAASTAAFFRAHLHEFEDNLYVDSALDIRHTDRRLGAYNINEG